MITAYAISQKGVKKVGISSKNIKWINCSSPTVKEIEIISSHLDIPPEVFKDSLDFQKRSRILSFGKYNMIVLMASCETQQKLKTAPFAFFIFKDLLLTVQNKPIGALSDFLKLPEPQRHMILKRGPAYAMYRLMDCIADDYFRILGEVESELNLIEDQILSEPTKLVTKKIFMQKRILIYMHKALNGNRDVTSALENQYIPFGRDYHPLFMELYRDNVQLIDLISTYRDMLTTALDMYLSSISNNLNKIMKTLTLISAFVLVPTLVGSIYGMNFKYMPEIGWKWGYPFALGLMLLTVLLFYFYFKRKGWIGWP